MKILVLGSEGQIGWELVRSLLPLGEVVGLGRQVADLAHPETLRAAVRVHKPHVIVNAAAYTAVDRAESEEAMAFAVNAEAPGILAEQAKRIGALLVHYSTDYVFDGAANRAYLETDTPNPQSVYGRSKLAGEKAIAAVGGETLILRTSWVYGARGHNFMRTILRLAQEQETLRLVADQSGAPTWSRWIADATAHIVRTSLAMRTDGGIRPDIYHLSSAGATSWHGFACAVIEQYRQQFPSSLQQFKDILPIASSDYPLPAKRPLNSRLDCSKLTADFAVLPPDWRLALRLCMESLNQ